MWSTFWLVLVIFATINGAPQVLTYEEYHSPNNLPVHGASIVHSKNCMKGHVYVNGGCRLTFKLRGKVSINYLFEYIGYKVLS